MYNKFIYLPNDDTKKTTSVDYNQQLMDTYLYEPTNQNSIKVPKVGKPTNEKTL